MGGVELGNREVDIFSPLVWFQFVSFRSCDLNYAHWALNPGLILAGAGRWKRNLSTNLSCWVFSSLKLAMYYFHLSAGVIISKFSI